MRCSFKRRGIVAGLLFSAAVTAEVRAGAINEIAEYLRFANFDVIAQHSPLSDGPAVLVSNQFLGNVLDFGATEVALQGPLSLQINAGTRGFGTLDISFRTALNRQAATQPLNYVIDFDSGAQASTVTGSLLIDGNLSLNQFGYYDLDLFYSSRQDVTRLGILSDSETSGDFDVGPIRVRGNIYFDVLAVLTDPLFEAAGVGNIFEALSGRQTLTSIFQDARDDALTLLASGKTADEFMAARLREQLPTNLTARPDFSSPLARGPAVPEPPVVLFLLLALPFILRRSLVDRHLPATF